MGFQIQIGSNSFVGTHSRAIKEDASRKVDAYVGILERSVVEFESEGVIFLFFTFKFVCYLNKFGTLSFFLLYLVKVFIMLLGCKSVACPLDYWYKYRHRSDIS